MRQEDITAALVQLKRMGSLLDDILDLTRQLAEAADREDQVTVRMLLAMRREPIEQLAAGEQQLRSQVAALSEEGRQLADHLIGKGVDAIADLYQPYDIVDDVDAVTTATIQSSKLISALWDGLNRRPYKLVDTSRLPRVSAYPDGMYRGAYMEDGIEQVALEFSIRDNRFEAVSYRALRYKDADYLSSPLTDAQAKIAAQFHQLTDYLVGRDVSAVNDLYQPGSIAEDTDVSSGATLSSPKVISAVWDGLNRHAYRID